MGILDKLRPPPDWKHPDPAVRLAAVHQLAEDAADALLETMAREDADARVRRAATERVTDAGVLVAIARHDADQDVRVAASAILVDIARDTRDEAVGGLALDALVDPRSLAELARSAALEAIGRAALRRVTESRSFAAVARRAIHPAIRHEALQRIADQAELAAVALKSEHKDVALAALERLEADGFSDRDTIGAVAARAKCKVVARRAKAILRARDGLPQPPSPEAVHAQRTELCHRLERLGRSDRWETAADERQAIQTAWEELRTVDPDAPEDDLARRFTQAAETFRRRLAEHQCQEAEAAERQAARAASVAARVALCERAERVRAEEGAREVDAVRAEWTALPAGENLDPDEARRLHERFAAGCRDAERRQEQWQRIQAWRANVTRSLDAVDAIVDTRDPGDVVKRWSAVRAEWPDLEGAWNEPLRARVQRIEARLHARQAEAREAEAAGRRVNLARLSRQCDQLEALARSKTLTLKQAERAFRDARLAAGNHAPLPARRDRDLLNARLKAVQKALYPRLHELREVDAWQRWANVSVQEDLCRQVEALGEVADPAEVARRLRDCVAGWKAAAAVPRERAAALWQRFKAAHDLAYARCAAFHAQQAREQDEHLKRKTALCEQAETLATSTDWIRTAARIVELQVEWKTIGPVPRRHTKAVWNRFRAACDRFFLRRKADLAERKVAWARNWERKTALCVGAEALADSTDWTVASTELKRLQAEWRTIGPVRKNRSDAIWQRFQAAQNRFAERYAQRDVIELAGKVAAHEALCAELEALLGSGDAGPATPASEGLVERVQSIQQRWQQAGRLPPQQGQALTLRYQDAIGRLVEASPDSFRGTDLDPYKHRRRMEQLCARVEQLAAEEEARSATGLSPAELLARTWRDALATNTMGARVDEAARRRAAADEVKRAQAEWKRLAPARGEAGRARVTRFRHACDRFFARRSTRAPSGASRHTG